MPTLLCLGEALIDFVADVSGVSLADCPGFRKAPGGAPANVAVGAARLGTTAAFLGKVGADPFGQFLARTFADAGVDTRFLQFDPDTRTGLAFVSLQANGERDFMFYRNPSADMLYRPDEVPDEAFMGCRAYHFGSITLIQEPSHSATLHALRRARAQGAIVSYDPNLRPPLWPNLDTARARILEALPLTDFVKVSREEAEFLYGPGTEPEWEARLLAAGPQLVAITDGENGCTLAADGFRTTLPAFAVPVVDTTGAGDGFVAGVLVSLLERGGFAGLDSAELHRIARFASAVGALACTARGAIPALPSRAQVEEFLSSA